MNVPKTITYDLRNIQDPSIKNADDSLTYLPDQLLRILKDNSYEHILVAGFEDLPPSVNSLYRTRGNRGNIYMTSQGKKWKRFMRQVFEDAVLEQHWIIPEDRIFIKMYLVYETDTWVFPDPNNMFKLLIDSAEGVIFSNDKYVLTDIVDFVTDSDKKATHILFAY